ncbi:MAG: efflux RND transporter permease subunit [Halobacteriovoraceae bacterium]|nr:efflux RND transporter permease subunit [Halobacteriovoraceae bacterium]MCB9095283.1 efflux RND transporter permease subunit [Halobacteriovoraceae bacterium]
MQKIAKFFIENSKLTIVLSIGIAVFGYQGLNQMNAESFPAVSFATATIVTFYDGATASDIETKITKPIEDEIRGVSGLKDVRSTSQAGLSNITVRVDMDDPKVNVADALDEVQKAVDRVSDLPSDLIEPPKFTELKSEEFPVVELAITGPSENRARDLIADQLKEEIEDNRSVKEVRLVGYGERVFDIFLNLQKMKEKYISVNQVLEKVASRNSNTPGGALKTDLNEQLVRIEGKVSNTKELEEVVVRSNFSGSTVYLKDIATIHDSKEEVKTLTRYNGEDATLLIVNKKGGADTIKMVGQIDQILKDYRDRYPEYKFNVFHSEGQKVRDRVDVLTSNAYTGLILVVVFLFFFLPGKIGLVASLSLPLAMLGTLGFMPSFGMNIDAITILALVIALGMMVDNSVVISENFTRLRSEGQSPLEAASNSIESLWLPITATAFTTIAAFLPMLVTKGVMGQFIKWIPIVVTIALLLSLFESFIFLPMRLTWAGKKVKLKDDDGNTDWFSKFERKFEKFMTWVVTRRYKVLFFFSAVIIFSFFMMIVANKFILFPADQTEIYIARLEMPKGTRLEETHKKLGEISKQVKEVLKDDVDYIVARAGTSQTRPNDPKAQDGNNIGMLTIYVSEYAKYNRPYTDVLNDLRVIKPDDVDSLLFEEMVNGPPVGNAIEATFRSNSNEDLDNMIGLVKDELAKIDGVENLKVNDIIGDDEVFVDIDYTQAARIGIDVNKVGSTIRTAISGNRISDVTLDNKEVDLIVRFDEPFRKNIDDLKSLLVSDPDKNLVPLGSFANFRVEKGTPQIKRFDFKRAKTLTGDVDTTKITSMQANKILKTVFEKNRDKIPGISLVFGGAQESTNESMSSLFAALKLSLIGIFALLVFLFKSYLRPAIIMSTIPLGLFGFSVAFYLHGRPISFLALIGIIGLGGIIVNSGIVLISFIDEMRAEGKLPLDEILIKASGMRLRAVLVTSLTTISGLLPTAYGIGGNDALLIPMTLALAWGLTSGTVLTLIWVPAAYGILEDFEGFRMRFMEKIWKRKEKIDGDHFVGSSR